MTDLRQQGDLFVSMLGCLIDSLTRKAPLKKTLRKLRDIGHVHEKRGIKPELYGPMLDALHDTFDEFFGIDSWSAFKHMCRQMCTIQPSEWTSHGA